MTTLLPLFALVEVAFFDYCFSARALLQRNVYLDRSQKSLAQVNTVVLSQLSHHSYHTTVDAISHIATEDRDASCVLMICRVS